MNPSQTRYCSCLYFDSRLFASMSLIRRLISLAPWTSGTHHQTQHLHSLYRASAFGLIGMLPRSRWHGPSPDFPVVSSVELTGLWDAASKWKRFKWNQREAALLPISEDFACLVRLGAVWMSQSAPCSVGISMYLGQDHNYSECTCRRQKPKYEIQ